MISQLAQMINTGQGGLSPNKAKQMINTILPMAKGDQRSRLEKLLRLL